MKNFIILSFALALSACNNKDNYSAQNGEMDWPHGKASRTLTSEEKKHFNDVLVSTLRAEAAVNRLHTPENKSNDEVVEKMYEILKSSGCQTVINNGKNGEKTIYDEIVKGDSCAIQFSRHIEATANQQDSTKAPKSVRRIEKVGFNTFLDNYKQLNDVYNISFDSEENTNQINNSSRTVSTKTGSIYSSLHRKMSTYYYAKIFRDLATNTGRGVSVLGIEMPFGICELMIMATSINGKIQIKYRINGEEIVNSSTMAEVSKPLVFALMNSRRLSDFHLLK